MIEERRRCDDPLTTAEEHIERALEAWDATDIPSLAAACGHLSEASGLIARASRGPLSCEPSALRARVAAIRRRLRHLGRLIDSAEAFHQGRTTYVPGGHSHTADQRLVCQG